MKKIVLFALTGMTALILSACQTTPDQEEAARKGYDAICKNEPPLYAAYITVATAKGASEKTLLKAGAVHDEITLLCTNRPTDIVSGIVQLSSAYARFVTLNAQLKE